MSGQKPNLDLIAMVQRARRLHDEQARPSAISAVYWVEAHCDSPDCRQPTASAGQWVISVALAEVDAVWARVREATQAGKLGYKAKVATAPRADQGDDRRLLMVCTYDSHDQADVQRVRAALESLGIGGDWRYQAGGEASGQG